MSSHMKPKRSWPGVPNRYITRLSSTVMRPKSIATVVVVLPPVCVRSSTPADTEVIAASVRSGSISEIDPTKVVLPTPKPPAITNLTGRIRPPARDCVVACILLSCGSSTAGSDGAHAVEHLREHVELDLDRIGVVDGEEVLSDQVTCDDGDHADDETQLGGRLGDRLGLLAERQELLLLGGQAGGRLLHGRL